jgi:hypothetical protein
MNNLVTTTSLIPDEVKLEFIEELFELGELYFTEDGSLAFKGSVIILPETDIGEDGKRKPPIDALVFYDKRGFSKTLSPQGGRTNQRWNDFLAEMRQSSDPIDRAMVNYSPRFFVFLDELNSPEKGTYESRRIYFNNNRSLMMASFESCVFDFVDCNPKWIRTLAYQDAMTEQNVEFWNVDTSRIPEEDVSWDVFRPGSGWLKNPRRLGPVVPDHFYCGAGNFSFPDFNPDANEEFKDGIVDSAIRWFKSEKKRFIKSPLNKDPRPLP